MPPAARRGRRTPAAAWRSAASGSGATTASRLAAARIEQVALAAHRADVDGLRGIGLDLAAQAGDASIDAAVERIALVAYQHVDQGIARQPPQRMLDEAAQEREFGGRQFHLAAVAS